jgi:hypothetical protein
MRVCVHIYRGIYRGIYSQTFFVSETLIAKERDIKTKKSIYGFPKHKHLD